MKTGMELVKELRDRAFKVLENSNVQVDVSSGGLFDAADLLQAWLREADKELAELSNHNVVTVCGATTWAEFIRQKLLGTTPKGSS